MAFNLADVFETVADAVPDTIALTYEGVDHSYRQLEVESNQVAHMLTAAEVGAGEHVARISPRRLPAVAAGPRALTRDRAVQSPEPRSVTVEAALRS